MAQVLPLRPHTFRLDNTIIDDYAAEMGAIGLAVYAVLQRYADRTTGQCWPSVATIARLLALSKNCVKKYLHRLAALGLLTSTPRYTAEGDPTSNLYTLPDPTQPPAVQQRRQAGGAPSAGGGAPAALPPQESAHLVPHPWAPGGPDQEPPEQFLTSAMAPQTLAGPSSPPQPPATLTAPCDHPEHPHWAPTLDLQICTECFRCWTPPLAPSVPAEALAPSLAAQPMACSG